MTVTCPCGGRHHSQGLCRPCYQKQIRPAHHVETLGQRQARVTAAQEKYPSTRFDAADWFTILLDDNGLYERMLGDMAQITGQRVRRGTLVLDGDGREVS